MYYAGHVDLVDDPSQYIHIHLRFREQQVEKFEHNWNKRNLEPKEEFTQRLAAENRMEKQRKQEEEKEQAEQKR